MIPSNAQASPEHKHKLCLSLTQPKTINTPVYAIDAVRAKRRKRRFARMFSTPHCAGTCQKCGWRSAVLTRVQSMWICGACREDQAWTDPRRSFHATLEKPQ
jgi:hypothetical protein